MTQMQTTEHLLEPVSEHQPAGDNLEYTDSFLKFLQASQGKEEHQIGESKIPAEEPHWDEVCTAAYALLERSKDLRVATILTTALLKTEGLGGFCRGVALIRGLLERYWDSVHPQIEDDGNAIMRVNAVAALGHPETTLLYLRHAPLVDAPPFPSFSLRDIENIGGDARANANGADAPPDSTALQSAIDSCPADKLRAVAETLDDIIEHIEAIEQSLIARVGAAQSADLGGLSHVVSDMLRRTLEWLPSNDAQPPPDASAPAPRTAPAADDGALHTREEVLKALDRVCTYFARYEPSSPVPLLVRRARRLVSMDFMAIIGDLSPDAVPQIQSISGPGSIDEGADDG